jgi:phosphoglycolate phosphatase-like HAD superfamily hydrolase/uridine kinase
MVRPPERRKGPSRPLCFDAVIFDLDGTLVATDRFWVDAARAGARRAFEELGLERELPSAEEWMSMVGLPLARGFDHVFADLDAGARAVVLERCVEEEHRALRAGQAALLPGARETLDELRARGVALGIASNCGQSYLDAMLHGLGLGEWVREARCLDTPGVRNKAAMVRSLLETFGTRSAVMVGDRTPDRDAAWENGIPHVHYARGFAAAGEVVEAEAVIEDLGALVPVLERRGAAVGQALDALGVRARSAERDGEPPRAIAVTGHSGAGKALFARDLARIATQRGFPAVVVPFDLFLRAERPEVDLTRTAFVPGEHALDHVRAAFDLEGLVERVLAPHARGEALALDLAGRRVEVPKGALLVVEGLFLLHPDLAPHFDKRVHLACDETVALRRIAGRDGWTKGPESVLMVRRHFLPMQRAFDQRRPPAQHADLVLDLGSALEPIALDDRSGSAGPRRPKG